MWVKLLDMVRAPRPVLVGCPELGDRGVAASCLLLVN